MTGRLVRRISVLIGLAGVVAFISWGNIVSGQPFVCGMQLNQSPVVFCETFDEPFPVTNRSGQANGELWGVSRQAGGQNVWAESTLDGCNGPQPASPIGATDVIVCNGQLRQVTNDYGDVSVMAMYPKQPFNFAGRTGTVAFDVTNDTSGGHGAWPEFWMTDQPVPVPTSHFTPCDMCTMPRHGFGIRFDAERGSCPGGWRASSAIIVRNYVPEDQGIFDQNQTGTEVHETGCASLSSGPNGGLNHVEIRVSENQIDVYASDAGRTNLHHINTITNANLSFTQGLIWIGDYHYNAEKAHDAAPEVPSQRIHTYAWDNVAFDGPPTYRDISVDVLDGTEVVGTDHLGHRIIRTGWNTTPSTPATLTTLPMTSAHISAATSAFLLFSWGKDHHPTTFNYRINGHANSAPIPPTLNAVGMRSLALPVPKNQLVNGTQNIVLSSDTDMLVQNVNIVLVAAAPVPSFGPPPSSPTNLRLITGLSLNPLGALTRSFAPSRIAQLYPFD